MTTLEKAGYRIKVAGWVGNLGNHLIQISGAINVAKHTASKVIFPDHDLLRLRELDFSEPSTIRCNETVSGRFFFQSDCFQWPVQYDLDRRKLFRDYVLEDISRRSIRELIADGVRQVKAESVSPDTLVINIRSGRDIFRPGNPAQADYMQPPLSFYKRVIEEHGYDDCLIVTQADRLNPCVDALLAWRKDIRIKTHRSVRDDLRTLLSARHLVMCHSSFSWCFALMSRNLRVLHQPETFRILGVPDLSIYTYHFKGYIRPGEWTYSEAQRDAMLNHSVSDISVTHDSAAAPGEYRAPMLSAFW
jgi:hypothetical protein